jgi:DNA repair photolyase
VPDVVTHDRLVKHLLRKGNAVDPFFVGKFSFSPYQACAHGCRYCDGRAERYFVEGEFDRDIVVRRNAPEVLASEASKLRERGVVFVGSGISDAYQPIEAETRLMAACGRVLADHRLPVTILTKSALVSRDIDLWAEVNERAGFLLMMSIATLDEELRRVMEPGASPIEDRLETLRLFKARGCAVGVAAMPWLPLLGERSGGLEALVARLAGLGVDFVLAGGLTLRPGRQKEAYFETLRASFPDLVADYERLYAENRESGAPRPAQALAFHARAEEAVRRAGLPIVVPHRVYRNRVPLYDELDVLLQHMATLYRRGHASAVRRLDASRCRYCDWLAERKAVFNRHRRMREQDLADELRALAATDAWAQLLGSEKLGAFTREVILERRIFDERTLRLVSPQP